MIFGEVATEDAIGNLLAHGLKGSGFSLRKGHVVSAEDAAALLQGGIRQVVVARLQPGDVAEDEAAGRVAATLAGADVMLEPAALGRANLYAAAHGLAVIDAGRVSLANAVDEAITIATLPEYAVVCPRQMLATVKIIPFSAPARSVDRVCELLAASSSALRVARFQAHRAGLIQTRLPGVKETVLSKTAAITAARLEALGSTLARNVTAQHAVGSVAAAIAAQREQGLDPILIIGASAIVDRRDVIPAAVTAAGGEILRFGMPVDPGNLLLLARISGTAILGLPGCARSPKRNGLDWILQRLLARIEVGAAEIMRLGVGGLLTEIPERPQLRQSGQMAAGPAHPPARVAAIVLAAGLGTRMRGADKLLVEIEGKPLVRFAVDAALGSVVCSTTVVVGHRGEAVQAALAGTCARIVENPRYAEGLSSSIAAGVAGLGDDIDGVVILLGDMPRIRPAHIDRLIAGFAAGGAQAICVPEWRGRRGNPVLWPRDLMPELAALSGDVGGRDLLSRHGGRICAVEIADAAIFFDVDEERDLAGAAAEDLADDDPARQW